jgi:hypothetical protein
MSACRRVGFHPASVSVSASNSRVGNNVAWDVYVGTRSALIPYAEEGCRFKIADPTPTAVLAGCLPLVDDAQSLQEINGRGRRMPILHTSAASPSSGHINVNDEKRDGSERALGHDGGISKIEGLPLSLDVRNVYARDCRQLHEHENRH